jgi:hypothetical protein
VLRKVVVVEPRISFLTWTAQAGSAETTTSLHCLPRGFAVTDNLTQLQPNMAIEYARCGRCLEETMCGNHIKIYPQKYDSISVYPSVEPSASYLIQFRSPKSPQWEDVCVLIASNLLSYASPSCCLLC